MICGAGDHDRESRAMTISRRNMMQLSAAGAATLAVGARVAPAVAQATDDIRKHAAAWFAGRGFAQLPPLGLVTGHAFNDGLRYDESRTPDPQQNWFSIQYVARVGDIDERDRAGVLAGFHIIAIGHPAPAAPGALLNVVLEYLIDERKLDPARMLFVSTELFEPHRARVARYGVDRFMQRSLAEAKAAGDGSGHFEPRGHPAQPSFASVGIYYTAPGVAPTLPTAYPPPGYIEIAEVSIAAGSGGQGVAGSAGIGLERLAMAEGKPVPDFEQSRRALLQAIEVEARRTKQPLPPGHARFAAP
jgi:hypothetical protein